MFSSLDTPKSKKARIELIPMIDVMMFLLVFFVLISINVIPGFGLGVQLPSAAHASVQHAKKTIIISIQHDGQLAVGDELVSADNLTRAIARQVKPNETPALIINGDASVEYRHFVKALDLLKGSGYTAISIATKKAAP